jgi:hypothetical protein
VLTLSLLVHTPPTPFPSTHYYDLYNNNTRTINESTGLLWPCAPSMAT